MDYSHSFAISAAGMTAERTRVDVAAINLANANSVLAADGSGFRPLRAVIQAGPASLFDQMVGQGLASEDASVTLPRAEVMPDATALSRTRYEPGHPLADNRGMVSYPAVDTAAEMVTLMTATRAYEANVAAMNTSRSLAIKALDIGGRNG